MSKGKQQTNTSVPEYQESFYRDVYDRARSLSNTPFQAYTGQMVADMNPAQQQQYNRNRTKFPLEHFIVPLKIENQN